MPIFYVTMIPPPPGKYDGEGRINKHIIALDTIEEAETVASYYKLYSAMQYINIRRQTPKYKPGGFIIKTTSKAQMSPTLKEMRERLKEKKK
jgi:hypothetical protein